MRKLECWVWLLLIHLLNSQRSEVLSSALLVQVYIRCRVLFITASSSQGSGVGLASSGAEASRIQGHISANKAWGSKRSCSVQTGFGFARSGCFTSLPCSLCRPWGISWEVKALLRLRLCWFVVTSVSPWQERRGAAIPLTDSDFTASLWRSGMFFCHQWWWLLIVEPRELCLLNLKYFLLTILKITEGRGFRYSMVYFYITIKASMCEGAVACT